VQDKKANTKNPKTNKTNKNTQKNTQKPQTKRQLENARRDDNIVSPQGLVWQCKTRAKQQTSKRHTAICEPGSNRCTLRKPSRSQSASGTGNILTDYGYDPKASNDAVMSHLESRNRKVKRVEADLR